ncbi:NAD(P)-dependent alcohol dehydrogenase [Tardiphaga sp. P5_C7]
MQIRAAVAVAPDKPFEIVSCHLREPSAGEVLVRIAACGICHLDVAVKSLNMPLSLPRILGHEGAGVVEKVGPGVASLAPGDHVLMSYGSCGACRSCASGAPSYCAHSFKINFLGDRGREPTHNFECSPLDAGFFAQSSFATHAIATERNTFKVDADLPLHLLAPLGCGFQTGMGSVMLVLRPRAGDSIVVFGCGSVGMAAVIAARIVGCSTIIAVDNKPQRLALSREMGATHIIDSSREDVAARIRQIVPAGTRFAFDTTGLPTLVEVALESLEINGTLGIVAPSKPDAKLTFESRAIIASGRTIRGIVQGDAISADFIPRMIDFYRRGELALERLIETFPFKDINAAVQAVGTGQALKAVLLMGPADGPSRSSAA